MTGLSKTASQPVKNYYEESPRLAVIIAIVAVIGVAIPMGIINKKISDEGSLAADVSLYLGLANKVDSNVRIVREMLDKGVVDEAALAAMAGPRVTLITPDINPTDIEEAGSQDSNKLDVKLTAIYWNPKDPLVTIDGENYRVGDKVNGNTILEIRKTEVIFRSPLGDKIIKYFYDYL